MIGFLGKIFKSSNQRRVDGYGKIVQKINAQEEGISGLSDEQFKTLSVTESDGDEGLVKIFAGKREERDRE